MTNIMITTTFMLLVLVACETEDPVKETSIIADEGATIVVSAVNEDNPGEQLDFIGGIVHDLTEKGDCIVGKTILLEAAVAKRSLILIDGKPSFIASLVLETNTDKLWISVGMGPVKDFLPCLDYYNEGETYVFPLLIRGIAVNKIGFDWEWREGDPISFDVYAEIVITEDLEKELRNVDCADDAD